MNAACLAPRAPDGCAGDVAAHDGVPLCRAHSAALTDLTGPWRTESGARDWIASMRAIVAGQSRTSSLALEEPSADNPRAPWIDWKSGARESFKWIGGQGPGWDSDDSRARYDTGDRGPRKRRRAVPTGESGATKTHSEATPKGRGMSAAKAKMPRRKKRATKKEAVVGCAPMPDVAETKNPEKPCKKRWNPNAWYMRHRRPRK